jgi:hypothetical protein
MAVTLRPSKAPNLPIAPVEYSQQYVDQLLNALRLYFAQVDNLAFGLTQNNGGAYLSVPYAGFHFNTQHVLQSTMTSTSTTPITLDTTAGYTAPGAILIGTEIITYTTVTPTILDGTITRGAYGTNKAAHAIGDAVTSVQATVALTRTPVLFNVTDYSNGVFLVSSPASSAMTTTIAGIYDIQFSFQFSNPDTAADNVTIWYVVNGVDIPATAGVVAVPSSHGGFSGQTIAGWNGLVSLNLGDVFEIYWSTESGNSVLTSYPIGTVPIHPASPAAIITFAFISAIPVLP